MCKYIYILMCKYIYIYIYTYTYKICEISQIAQVKKVISSNGNVGHHMFWCVVFIFLLM